LRVLRSGEIAEESSELVRARSILLSSSAIVDDMPNLSPR
jgi:hypothetical protein